MYAVNVEYVCSATEKACKDAGIVGLEWKGSVPWDRVQGVCRDFVWRVFDCHSPGLYKLRFGPMDEEPTVADAVAAIELMAAESNRRMEAAVNAMRDYVPEMVCLARDERIDDPDVGTIKVLVPSEHFDIRYPSAKFGLNDLDLSIDRLLDAHPDIRSKHNALALAEIQRRREEAIADGIAKAKAQAKKVEEEKKAKQEEFSFLAKFLDEIDMERYADGHIVGDEQKHILRDAVLRAHGFEFPLYSPFAGLACKHDSLEDERTVCYSSTDNPNLDREKYVEFKEIRDRVIREGGECHAVRHEAFCEECQRTYNRYAVHAAFTIPGGRKIAIRFAL